MKKIISIIVLCAVACTSLFSKATDRESEPSGKTPIEGIFHWTLDNGLDVFAIESHRVPLVYIEVAVKAGGITQTRETAGLFHLYEHMMFKGNSLYRSAAAVQKAISDFGVPDWNGTTGLECVNYFFTVPRHLVREGMEFWERAIVEPLLNEAELENEKKVVLSEITADNKNPSYLAMKCALNKMFPDSPWQVDPSGDPTVVQNATVDAIRDIQRTYYVPNNAALFVAGDVVPLEVYNLSKEIYGGWEKGADVPPPDVHTQNPLQETTFMISINDKTAKDTALINIYMRGPDLMTDTKSTYSADMSLSLFNDPTGPLCAAAMGDKDLGIIAPDRVSMGYQTRRATSLLTFSAMINDADRALHTRAASFLAIVQNVCADVASGKTKIPPSVFKRTLVRLKDDDIRNSELPDAIKSNLRYWWTVSTPQYYYDYNKSLSRVKQKDIASFLVRYTKGNALVIVTVNSETYSTQADAFKAAGFKVIEKEDALWWEEK